MKPNATPNFTDRTFDHPPAEWLPTLTALLHEQGTLCERLESLGASQSAHVQAGHTDALLSVLGERQSVLDRVMEINAALEPFRSRREAAMASLRPEQRTALQAGIDRIAEAVDRVRLSDDRDRRQLESQRNSVADELAGFSRLRGAAAAYAGSAQSSPRFHDRRG